MEAIDFRVRPNTEVFMRYYASHDWAGHWRRFRREPPMPCTLGEHVAELHALGIGKVVCTGRQRAVPGDASERVSNDYIAECVQQFPDTIIGFAGIDPTAGMQAVREVSRCIGLGLRGVSVDVRQPQRTPDDRQYYMVYSKAAELEVPVVLTLGPFAGRFGSLGAVDQAASDFPEVTFVLSHGLWPDVQGAAGIAFAKDNVYIETSVYPNYPGVGQFWDAVENLISDRVIYASGFPFLGLDTVRAVRELSLSDATREKLLRGNAARVLGIDK